MRSGSGVVKEWKLKDCIAVHKILVTILDDHAAASSKSSEKMPNVI